MNDIESIKILKKLKNDKYTAMQIKNIARLKEKDDCYVLTPKEREALDTLLLGYELIWNELSDKLKIINEKQNLISKMADYISNLDIDEDICKYKIKSCNRDNDINACIKCVIDFFREE